MCNDSQVLVSAVPMDQCPTNHFALPTYPTASLMKLQQVRVRDRVRPHFESRSTVSLASAWSIHAHLSFP